MSPAPECSWTFEKVDPSSSGSSGKISDLFRNEGVEERGHLLVGAPNAAATLMAREVIQNSWDAARELRQHEEMPPFELEFDFGSATGTDKADLIDSLALRQLADHAREVAPTADERRSLGLGEQDCLLDLDQRASLPSCTVVERGASGMYGAWSGAESRMYLAMLSIGYNEKEDGSGGTFGYGKAGLIRASHPRIVVAYTCFRERADDPHVSRRLLGVTYWGRHRRDGQTLSGFARFGQELPDGTVVPFQNDAADTVAASLGFEPRHPTEPMQLGTTFLIIDPAVDPDDLRVAIERNWWPALLDHRFVVLINRPDGSTDACRPHRNEQLRSYIEAYEYLETRSTPEDDRKALLVDLGRYRPSGGEEVPLGKLALVADPADWSFPDDPSDDTDNRSFVALMRDPRMVVEYHLPGRDISRRVPYVRGVFLAAAEVNPYLAATEPKAHNKWDTRPSDDVPIRATRYAREITARIREAVRKFQDDLRPPVDESVAVRLQRLDDKLARLRNRQGHTPPPPPRGERPFRIEVDVERRAAGEGLVLTGNVDLALADDVEVDEMPCRIRFSLALDEDGRRGTDVPLNITPPSGFAAVDGTPDQFEGTVGGGTERFELESAPYRADWTGDLLVSAEPTGAASEAA